MLRTQDQIRPSRLSSQCKRAASLFAIIIFSTLSSNALALPSGVLVPLKGSVGVDKEVERATNTSLSLTLASKVMLVDENKTKVGLKKGGCEGAGCAKSAIKVDLGSEARFAFVPSMENEFDIYTLKLTIVDADHSGSQALQIEANCEFCDADGIKAKFKDLLSSKDVKSALSKPGKPKAPTSFTLSLVTSPSNAEVLINGKSKGRTPLSIPNLKSETYRIEVKLKGYVSQKKSITPPSPLPSTAISESFTLKPKSPSSFPIIIKSKPKGATVTLDGVKIKVKSPFKARVKPGAHEIIFTKKGYEELKKSFVTPPQSETINLSVTLKKIEEAKPKPVMAQPKPQPKSQPVTNVRIPPRPPILANNWSGAALGVGAIMAGVGAWLVSQHGEITCNNGETRLTCPDIYNTKLPGGVLLGMGTAAIGASVITMLIRSDWPTRSPSTMKRQVKSAQYMPTVIPTQGGAAASFGFKF